MPGSMLTISGLWAGFVVTTNLSKRVLHRASIRTLTKYANTRERTYLKRRIG